MKKFVSLSVALFLLFTVFLAAGCNSRKIPANFDYGTWTGSTYRNDFFGFSFTVPGDWHIASKAEMAITTQEVQELDFVNLEEAKRIQKIADVTSAPLVFVMRYTEEEALAKEEFNPNIMLSVENISGVKVTRDKYVEISRQNARKAIPSIVLKPNTTKKIGGAEFASFESSFSANGVPIKQEYLIYLKNGFAMIFALTWMDDSEKKQLEDIMATLTWQ